MLVKWVQTFFTAAGDYSCYADCLIKLACDYNGIKLTLENIGKALDKGIDGGYIRFNQELYRDANNFTILNPCGWLKEMTGKEWVVEEKDRHYQPKKNEYEILFYAMSEDYGAHGIGHFVLPDWCPTQFSNTLKYGFVYSKRILRRK